MAPQTTSVSPELPPTSRTGSLIICSDQPIPAQVIGPVFRHQKKGVGPDRIVRDFMRRGENAASVHIRIVNYPYLLLVELISIETLALRRSADDWRPI
jgi:hypothetical protein